MRGACVGSEGEVTSDDDTTQFYDVRGPTRHVPILMRARLTTTLGVAAYDLLDRPTEPGQELKPDLTFRARMRYDADYGATPEEATPTRDGDRFVARVLARPRSTSCTRVRRGQAGDSSRACSASRSGGQYVTDALGWWSFDGGEIRVTTPAYFALEAYGGLEVRGGLPFSGSVGRWEADGVWRGDRSGMDPTQYPSFQQDDVAPAMGVALETAGVNWVHARLTYRRVYNTGDSIVSQFQNGDFSPITYSGTRISSEKLGYALNANASKVGGVSGGVVYDFYANATTNVWATADLYLGKRLIVSVDYDYFQPTYDADSIWNFFAMYPMNDVGARVLVGRVAEALVRRGRPRPRVQGPDRRMPATAGQGSPSSLNSAANPIAATIPEYTFNGGRERWSARYRKRDTQLSFNGVVNAGDQGDRVGGDVAGEHVFDTHYLVSGRVGLWHWEDSLRPDRSALSFGAVLGGGYRIFHGSQVGVEWENDINQLVGWRMRVLGYLRLTVTK